MIKRKKQKITSRYGYRTISGYSQFHKGVDLRSFNFTNWKRQKVILPEACIIRKIGYQRNWGWNVVSETLDGEYTFKFIHLRDPRKLVKMRKEYPKGTCLGYTTTTDYMKAMKYDEHLHFEVHQNDKPINPMIYFEDMGFDYV